MTWELQTKKVRGFQAGNHKGKYDISHRPTHCKCGQPVGQTPPKIGWCGSCYYKELRDRGGVDLVVRRAPYKRAWNLKKNYGITPEKYEEILIRQDGKCAICLKRPDYNLHVDHDHQTNTIRGLLCNECNRAIGLLGDNTETLKRAIGYLMETK
jgi:hypothetical protein